MSSVIRVDVELSQWGGIPNWGYGAGYMCPLFVCLVCMHVCMCHWDVYMDSGVCTSGSAFVSGMFGVFQPLLMYRLIT